MQVVEKTESCSQQIAQYDIVCHRIKIVAEMRERKLKSDTAKEKASTSSKDVFEYRNPHHQNALIDSLGEFFHSQTLCDVTLVAEGQEIKAHRAVLAACSPYFATMFTADLKECQQDVIEMRNITYLSLQKIVTFCYTCAIQIPADSVYELLTAADMLQFPVIKESSSAYLSSKLTPANCIEISIFADIHSCQSLKEFSRKYAQENFRYVAKTDAFREANFEQVKDLVTSESLCITTEKDVFDAVMTWVKYDVESREQILSTLLGCVRLNQLPPKELIDCVESEQLIQANPTCMKMINAAKNFHLLPDWSSEIIPVELMSRSMHRESKVYIVGGEVHQKVFNSLEVYSMSKNKWETLKGMHKARDGVGVCSYDGKIYAIGGCDGKTSLGCIEVYDPDTNGWEFRSSMHEARHALSVAKQDGWIYALGGSDFTTTEFSSAERYDPVRDNWSVLPQMNAKREGLVSISLDGAIYAIGGDNGVCILNTVERFDPRTGKWYFTTPMGFRRRYFGGTILNGIIYVAGGSDFDEDLNSVECFDPRANRWQFLPSMMTRRESVAVTALGDKILALGGACLNKETGTVEIYDPLLNRWDNFIDMPKAKEGMGVVVL